MKALPSAFLILALLATSIPAGAAVNVERSSSENPMVEVARSTLYGGLTGAVLGGAIALANDGHNGWDYVKWGYVAGTFFGFAYGLYHVSSRPRADAGALLQMDGGKLALRMPEVAMDRDGTTRVRLVGARF